MIPDLRALRDPRLERFHGATRWVLLAIAGHIDDHGRAWPTVATIATEAGLSERSVRRAISELIAAGALTVQGRAGGRGNLPAYRLEPATLAAFSATKGGQDSSRKNDRKRGQKGGQEAGQPDPVPAGKGGQERAERRPEAQPKAASVAPEGYRKDDREEDPPFLDRLHLGGAKLRFQGEDLSAEWSALPAELDISEDAIVALLHDLPPGRRFPSAVRKAQRAAAEGRRAAERAAESGLDLTERILSPEETIARIGRPGPPPRPPPSPGCTPLPPRAATPGTRRTAKEPAHG